MPETVTVSFQLDKAIYDKVEATATANQQQVHDILSKIVESSLAGSCIIVPPTATAEQLRSMQAFAAQVFPSDEHASDFGQMVKKVGLQVAFEEPAFRQMIGAILNVAPDTTFWIQLSQPGILYLIQPLLDKREQIERVATPLKPSGMMLMFGIPIGVGMQQVTFDGAPE